MLPLSASLYSSQVRAKITPMCIFGLQCCSMGRVFISRHAIFDENCFPLAAKFKHLVPKYSTPLLEVWQSASPSSNEEQHREQI